MEALPLFLYSAQYHIEHCRAYSHAFEQFGALFKMHNHDDTYPDRPGFEPTTSRLQAPVDKNESFFRIYLKLRIYLELCYFKFRELGSSRNLKFRELEVPGTSELTLGCPEL